MKATLGLTASPTALQGFQLIVNSGSAGGSGPAQEETASKWESSLAALRVYTVQLNWFPSVGSYSVYFV